MPRMSKKRKQEWALFLNERNRITYNELCRKCSNDCKQSFRCILLVIAFLISPFGLPKLAFWLLGKVQDLKFAIRDLVYG